MFYNLAAVPPAIVDLVTLIAALAMSSSILVICNALRLGRTRLS